MAQTTNEQTSPQGQSVTNVTKKNYNSANMKIMNTTLSINILRVLWNSKIKIWILTLKDSGSNTSAMRYSEETKEFFWTGKRLLGGQLIRNMPGFTNE